jgi:hypothetical protein
VKPTVPRLIFDGKKECDNREEGIRGVHEREREEKLRVGLGLALTQTLTLHEPLGSRRRRRRGRVPVAGPRDKVWGRACDQRSLST